MVRFLRPHKQVSAFSDPFAPYGITFQKTVQQLLIMVKVVDDGFGFLDGGADKKYAAVSASFFTAYGFRVGSNHFVLPLRYQVINLRLFCPEFKAEFLSFTSDGPFIGNLPV